MTIIYSQTQKIPRNELVGNTIQFRHGISSTFVDKTHYNFVYDFTGSKVEILIKETPDESSLIKLLSTEDGSITVWNTADVPTGQKFNISADVSAIQTAEWGEVSWFYNTKITDSQGVVKTRWHGPLNIRHTK